MRNKPEIYVLLGTYNGEKFIREQIESIQAQTYKNWKLLIRDDDSQDSSLEIIRGLAKKDERIIVVENEQKNLGPCANFDLLAHNACLMGANYFCFADQDDVWQPQKLETQLRLMIKVESCQDSITPTLLHSDLIIVDKNLKLVHPSLMQFQKLCHEDQNPIRVLLVQNFVTGCTIMANRSLINVALPIPEKAIMHDWWLALCASAWGRIDFLPMSTVHYRQHGTNEIGAKGFWNALNPANSNLNKRLRVGAENFLGIIEQSLALKDRIICQKSPAHAFATHITFQFASLWQNEPSPIKRSIRLISLKIHRQNIFAHFLLIIRLLFTVRPLQNRRKASDG